MPTDEELVDWLKGRNLVTGELLDAARNLLSAALPEDASNGMIEGFWETVYECL